VIFVTVGTNEARFDRLLRAVTEISPEEDLFIQHGHSAAIGPPHSRLVDFLAFEEMGAQMRAARAVVTHAGVGTIMVALANGKRPIVLPRRGSLGEAVDDHQLQVGRRFGEAGLVTYLESESELATALAADHVGVAALPKSSTLASDLGAFLEDAVAQANGR
jgi:UDP-N-acetylglucosamine transferase subunit ALG13